VEACGGNVGVKKDGKQMMGFSGYLVWKSFGFKVLLIKQIEGNLVSNVRVLTCYTL
jgi:hypothetical protein